MVEPPTDRLRANVSTASLTTARTGPHRLSLASISLAQMTLKNGRARDSVANNPGSWNRHRLARHTLGLAL